MLANVKFQNKRELEEFVCIRLSEAGLTITEIAELKLPKTRKTVSKYIKNGSIKYGLKDSLPIIKPKTKPKIFFVGGSRDIENFQANRETNPSGSIRFTNIKKKDDYRLNQDN